MTDPSIFYSNDVLALNRLKDCSLELYKEAFTRIDPRKETWLITWNPSPRRAGYCKKDGTDDYILSWEQMLQVLWEADLCCEPFAFVPEVSLVGKLHMHGFFQIKDRVKLSRKFLPSLKKLGFIKTNIARSIKWDTFKYHVKDIDITRQFIPLDYPILITDMISEQIRDYVMKEWFLKKKLPYRIKSVTSYFDQNI